MKKIIKYVICLSVMVLLGSISVKAKDECVCAPEDNLCVAYGCYNIIIGIFDTTGKRTMIGTQSNEKLGTYGIDENRNYGYFKIRDREIYLNNSTIELYIRVPWSLLDYKIHVTGTNKITFLGNFNNTKYEDPDIAAAYPELYTKDFIPFSVEGDGTLEIEQATQIQKNSAGESYFTWELKSLEEMTGKNGNFCQSSIIGSLGSDCNWNSLCRNPGFTKSEIRQKFIEDKMQLGVLPTGQLGGATPLFNYYPENALDMDNQADRETWIDELLSEEPTTQTCNYMRLIPEAPVTEAFQLTRDFGEEYIITDMARSFTETGSYLLSPKEEEPVEELETVTTTQASGIVFESSEPFDSNYHLGISDVTEGLTDEEASKIEAKTDKVLIKLYDINMLDKEDNVVDMGNGTYTIKVALSDLLKKYNEYQVIYIGEEVEVLPAKVEGDYIVFNTTHLSKYGIVGSEVKTGNIVNPNTADNVLTYGLVLCSLAIAICLVTLRVEKLKKAN